MDVKGILFNLAEEVVEAAYGAATWERIIDASQVSGAYTTLGNYPDEEFSKIIGGAVQVLGAPEATVVSSIAEGAIPLLSERYPDFFVGHDSARSFVLTLNDIIHPEVKKLYPDVNVPEFDFIDQGPDTELLIGYHSARQLCALAEGFIRGAATRYGETVAISHDRCMHRGDQSCTIGCTFTPASPR